MHLHIGRPLWPGLQIRLIFVGTQAVVGLRRAERRDASWPGSLAAHNRGQPNQADDPSVELIPSGCDVQHGKAETCGRLARSIVLQSMEEIIHGS